MMKPGSDTWKNDEGGKNEYYGGMVYHPPPHRADNPPLPTAPAPLDNRPSLRRILKERVKD